jgi:hypothetical protein
MPFNTRNNTRLTPAIRINLVNIDPSDPDIPDLASFH